MASRRRIAPPRRTSGLACLACVALLAAVAAGASPVRVATLGGDGLLLLDSTNLFTFPSLAHELAQVDVEIFDEWAGGAVPLGRHRAAGLFLNRPTEATADLSRYLANRGSGLLRALEPRPWLDALYAARPGGVPVGIGVRYVYDVRDRGAREASAAQLEGRLGVSLGSGGRRLDGSLHWERARLRDSGDGVRRRQSGGTGIGLDLRGRWAIGVDGLLLPSVAWWHGDTGLAPEERRVDRWRAALAWNARLVPTALVVAGIVVQADRERRNTPGDGQPAARQNRYTLPAVVAGGEVQAGALLLRLGLRHESLVIDQDTPAGVDLTFDTAFSVDIGVGFEAGPVAIDGVLEKEFLRDGPHFLGGSAHGPGLLATLSLLYRLYP